MSKVLELWMPHTDCGLGHRHQQSVYSIDEMYVHGGGLNRVQTSLQGGGGVQGPGDAMRGLWVGHQASAKHA
jgi:hypothetical protein